MDVSCPACAARYTADDEKLRGKTARMRCRACGTVWLVAGPPGGGETKRAAVARRGAEREHRDLFATRPPETGVVRETVRPPPMGLVTSGLAARNETSVLFKLSDLVAGSRGARATAPGAEPARGMTEGPRGELQDDSGIIDLKALSMAPPAPARPMVAPLFASDAPPSAFAREVAGSSSFPRSTAQGVSPKLRLIGGVAAGVAVFALCGLGVAFTFSSDPPPPKVAAPLPLPAPPPTAAPAAPAPAPEPEPQAAAVAEAKPEAKHARKGTKAKATTAKGVITSKSPPPPPAKVKPADPCGCHGDFNCILACTAKGGK